MTKTYVPFNSGAGASVYEAQWSKMMNSVFRNGVVHGHLEELEVYGDSTGMQVKVKEGAGWVKGHFYENDAEETIAVSAADATNPRWDYVVLEVDWTQSDNQMSVKMVSGTPAASPSLPSLTQTTSKWQIPLAKVVVGAGVSTVTVANVFDLRKYSNFRVINGKLHKQFWVTGWRPTFTNGCGYSEQIEMPTNKNIYDCCSFLKAADSYAYANIDTPFDYSGGDIYAEPVWLHPSTTTNFKVCLGLAGVSIGDGESLDAAIGAFQYSRDIGGNTNYRYKGPLTGAITIAGTPEAGESLFLICKRYVSDSDDTLAVATYLRGWMIWYPVE